MERISIANPVFNGNEKKYLNECIDTGWVSANGKFLDLFQKSFAEFCGSKYALACSNGTVTLHLALIALGIGPGDEVIMPTLTYIATANAVRMCGATPVFVDSDPETWNVDPACIEAAITPRTKAIIPVHLYGLACDMTAIMEIADRHGIPVVEDAAEAHGAKWEGKTVGSIGTIGSFSFFGNKIITCGEGGMLVTDDEQLMNTMKLYRSQGVDPAQKRYWHIVSGYNYRMTNMQAAVGLGQLENVAWHLAQRKRVAEIYTRLIREKLDGYAVIQKVKHPENHVYWMNSIVLTEKAKQSRDDVMAALESQNVEMRPLFYPMHIMPPFEDHSLHFPVAERLSANGINLPSHAGMDEEKINYVVDCLQKAVI
ncbi:MAG: DegT/DnrJ/EryC1/StrS family aminotransferase [Clostridia bacterium]|nr:DegT/DnrJ/EryC1/StrS family aminotransferase [Clostridia bacterium]